MNREKEREIEKEGERDIKEKEGERDIKEKDKERERGRKIYGV